MVCLGDDQSEAVRYLPDLKGVKALFCCHGGVIDRYLVTVVYN